MIWSEPTQRISNTNPMRSIGVRSSGISYRFTSFQAKTEHARAIDRLMKKIQGHEWLSQIQPPRMGPNYFPSKEVLFFEVMFQATENEFEAVHACVDPASDRLDEVMREFGERLLRLIYSPELLPLRRLVLAESGRSELGCLVYEQGPKRSHAMLADFLLLATKQGKLRRRSARRKY